MRLKGANVLVTGAGGAIGAAIGRLLADAGARLALTDVDADALHDVSSALQAGGVTVTSQRADSSSLAEIGEFVRDAEAEHGPLTGAVNCAGYFRIEDFVDTNPDGWGDIIGANLLTTMAAARAVLPSMIAAGTGSIVNFASTAGEYGSIRPSAAYAAAKAGVIGFTKSLAREVSPLGVRVNALSPGPIDTPALKAVAPEARAMAAQRTLLGRLGKPTDIAHGVAFLLGDESAFITGTVLQINGGSLL